MFSGHKSAEQIKQQKQLLKPTPFYRMLHASQ